jgi:hypothetical protein
MSKNLYEPIKEQFLLMVEYIKILEKKKNVDPISEFTVLSEMIDSISKSCLVYVNYYIQKMNQDGTKEF